jgi:hypothetical protein
MDKAAVLLALREIGLVPVLRADSVGQANWRLRLRRAESRCLK